MCGRYSLFAPQADIEARFDAAFAFDFEARYNAAPSQSLPVITGAEPDTIQRMEWGLVPSFADSRKDHGYINARAETLTEKRSFADAYERRRCLVPVTGFYEWTETDGRNQPYRVAFEDDRPFAVAGIHETWSPPTRQSGLGEFGSDGDDEEDDARETFAIVTTEPNDLIGELHHRMAAILPPEREADWLHGDADEIGDLLTPYPDDELRAYPVSTDVNSPATDEKSLLEPLDDVDVPPESTVSR